MDHHRIDAIARTLSRTTTRQGAMRLLAAGLVAVVGSGSVEMAAKPKKKGKKHKKGGCRGNQERCQGECWAPCSPNQRRDPRGCECECVRTACTGGKEFDLETCRCECPSGLTKCEDGSCIGPDLCCPDERSCASGGCVSQGACCFDENQCNDGTCLKKDSGECCPGYSACPAARDGCCNSLGGEECTDDGCCDSIFGDMTVCNGKCIDTQTDKDHCGGCGEGCGEGKSCRNGSCGCGESATCQEGCCPPGYWCHHLGSCCATKDGQLHCTCPSGYCVSGGICFPC